MSSLYRLQPWQCWYHWNPQVISNTLLPKFGAVILYKFWDTFVFLVFFQKMVPTIWIGDFGKYLQNYTTCKHWTCTSMWLMTCEFQWCQYQKDCNLCSNDTAKRRDIPILSLANYSSITPVNIQQHPKVLKAVLVTIISCGMEEAWGIGLMQKCPQKILQERHRHCCLK